jgi:hypothetical protein
MARFHTIGQQPSLGSATLVRAVAAPRGKGAPAAPSAAKHGIVSWVLAWGLLTVAMVCAAILWGSSHRLVAASPAQTSVPALSFDAARCAEVAETWQAAGRAADQYRLTQLSEYQADADRLRDKARADGRRYCTGDPLDR